MNREADIPALKARLDRHLRWLPLVVLVVALCVLHWPAGVGFKADDYPAIRYASDPGNCLRDFTSSQYGLSFFVFYRPFITLSFGLDFLFFGNSPFGYFLMNGLALLVAALLLQRILRLLAPGPIGVVFAFGVTLLWICHPFLVPSLRWVAGRVDTHVAPPLLLALWLHLRVRRGGRRLPVWIVALVALGTKESALGLPLLALALDFLDPHPSLRPAPAMFGRALPALPYLLLIPGFFLFRFLVLGKVLGGYGFLATAAIDPGAVWQGLGHNVAATFGLEGKTPVLAGVLVVGGWILLGKREAWKARFIGVGLVVAGLFGPLVQLLPSMRSGDQRYAYLAVIGGLVVWVGLATVLARGLRPLALAIALLPLLLLLPAGAGQRSMMAAHDGFNRALLAATAQCEALLDRRSPVVIGGDAEQVNNPYRFLWGLGSVRKPPFTRTPREIVTLRKLHGLAEPAGALVTDGLAAHLTITREGPTLTVSARGSGARHRSAAPVGFDGTLRAGDFLRIVNHNSEEPYGFRLGKGYDGRVAVCTSVGSCVVPVPSDGPLLSLFSVFTANVTHRVGGAPLLVLQLIWNAMDLAKDSPIYLFWREQGGSVMASFEVTPAFTRTVLEALEAQ